MMQLALALAALLALQDPMEDKAREEEAKERIVQFRKDYAKAKLPEDRVALIRRLGETQHPKILDEMTKLLTRTDPEPQMAAAGEVAKYVKNETATKALAKAAKTQRDPVVAADFVKRIGDVGWKGGLKELLPLFRHSMIDTSRAAVETAGRFKAKEAITALLDVARELEAVRDDQEVGGGVGRGGVGPGGGGPGPSGPGPSNKGPDEKVKRKREVLPAAMGALRDITGQSHEKVRDWELWWRRHSKSWKDPEDEKKE